MSSAEPKPEQVGHSRSVHYPESDGQPMAESDLHRDLMLDLIAAAKQHFRKQPDVYVSGNLLVYFVEGDPNQSVAPDFFAVRGISRDRRRTFKVWEEGKGPEVVIELTSPSTHLEDLGRKRAVYEELGVREYFLFDPEGARLEPPLRGFRLEDGVFRPVRAEAKGDGTLVLPSEVLGLLLHGRGPSLRLVDPSTGERLPTPDELLSRVVEERRRAEEEKARAAEEKARAAEEKARADASELELARLRAEIGRLRGPRET